MLGAIEDGSIIFIGSTTENPHISMTRAIVSRCRVFELKPLTDEDVKEGLRRAVADKTNGYGNLDVEVTDEAYAHFAWGCSGDMRNALGGLELAVLTTPADENGKILIDETVAEQSIQKKTVSVDESTYYDMLSAFCKSLRGSDSDAALYWAFRLIESGLDPLIIFRRLVAHASEDVGLANSNALILAVSAMTAYEKLGPPEGFLALTHAIIGVCTSPKSNSVGRRHERGHGCRREKRRILRAVASPQHRFFHARQSGNALRVSARSRRVLQTAVFARPGSSAKLSIVRPTTATKRK